MVRKTKKKVGSVHTAKNGARYKIMANGQARFIKGGSRKRPKKGGSINVGGAMPKKYGTYDYFTGRVTGRPVQRVKWLSDLKKL